MLSDIIENVGDECGYAVVTSNILDSEDVTTKALLKMANRVAQEMADAYNWPRLKKSASITLVAGQATYALPADFSFYHYETFWNQTNRWHVFGPMSSESYAEAQALGTLSTVFSEFQIRGVTDNEITLIDTPDTGSAGEVIAFEYTARRPIRPQTWAVGQVVETGEYTFQNGIYYLCTAGGTTGGTGPATDSGATWSVYLGAYERFLADTDVPVLSERILTQGVLERYATLKQLTALPLYLNQLEEEFGKAIGGKILYAGGSNRSRFQYANNGRVTFGS